MTDFFNVSAKNLQNKTNYIDNTDELASFYKVFGDATRLKILFLLLEQELCVNDLALLINMNQSAVSHQLRLLRQHKIVKCRKDGKMSYYSLDDGHVTSILTQGIEHFSH